MKLEFHQIEDTVDELLKRTVVPTEEVYKLIDIYQVNLARDKLINGYLDEKTTRIDFDAFSKFYKEISNLADNEHLIDLKKIARLEKLHKYGSNILLELEKIGDKEMKKAKALLKEITDHKFYFERLKFFLDKLIVHHCYNTKGAEDEIYATLFYCKCLMKELSDPNKKFKDLDKKKAVRALKKKLQFTEEKLLEIKEMEDIPEMEELITQIKSNGLYTTDIHDLHERFKYCSTWFKETKTKISEDLKQKSMKDEEDEPDFVEEYYPLMVFDSSELNDYLKDVITIPELPFEKSHKLATNLRVCIWTQEYNKMNTEKKDDILDLEELTLLKDLANGFNLLPKD